MVLSRRASAFLVLVGVWSVIIWPRFAKAIWDDDRAWHHGPTAFFWVHAALILVSFTSGIAVGILGWRGLRHAGRSQASSVRVSD